MIFLGVFYFFKIVIFWVVRGIKGQKTIQNKKKILWVLLHISGIIHCMIVIYGTHICKMIISPCLFLIFSKFWFFGLLGGIKGQKTIQNDNKLSVLRSIFQEPYIVWLSFIVHMCRMITSQVVFFNFSKFWFSGVEGQKVTQNGKKLSFHNFDFLGFQGSKRAEIDQKLPISVRHTLYLRSCRFLFLRASSRFLVHRCKIMISPGVFLYFCKQMQHRKY